MKKLIMLLTLFMVSQAHAAAPDRRISDADGHVLNINSDGTIPVSLTGGSSITGGCLEFTAANGGNGEEICNDTNDQVDIKDDDGTVYGSFSATGITAGGANERVTGATTGEYIDFVTEDIICLEGAGGTDNTDFCVDLDGTHPVIYSENDTIVEVSDILRATSKIELDATGTVEIDGTTTASYLTIVSSAENIQIRPDAGTNAALLTSSTGVNILRFFDDFSVGLGQSSDAKIVWTTTGNDNLQIGTTVGSSAGSGVIGFMETADMSNANRSPLTTPANPTFRVYSADATAATDYIDIYHDQNNSVIETGGGSLDLFSGGIARVSVIDSGAEVTGTVVVWGGTNHCSLKIDADGSCDAGTSIGADNSIAICAVCAAN